MGIIPCPLPCHLISTKARFQDQTPSDHSSLSSQPSLPSVPSLTPPHDLQSCHSSAHLLSTLCGHSSAVFSLSLSFTYLLSASSDGQVRSWPRHHYESNKITTTNNVVASGGGAVKSLVVSGDKMFSAHQDHKIRVWKIDAVNNGNKQWFKCVATLPTLDDRFLRLFSADNYVEVRRHKKCTWVHHVDTVSCLALSNDGSLLYSASWDRSFKIWRTADFRCLESVERAHDDAINAIVVSTDGIVYTGSADKKIKVWKKGGEKKQKHWVAAALEKHRSAVNALALSSDGCVLYSGACDRSVLVWESDGGEMAVVGALRGHGKAVLCLAAVADLVCSGSADNTVRVWRRGLGRSYKCLAVLEGHGRPVKCLAAAVEEVDDSAMSRYVVYSGSLDSEIKVWRVLVPIL